MPGVSTGPIDGKAHNAGMTAEPCAACDRETAPGSPLFGTRRRGFDRKTGNDVVVCASCVADVQTHGARGNARLSTLAIADIFLSPPA